MSLGWKGSDNLLATLVPWAETPSKRPGCSGPAVEPGLDISHEGIFIMKFYLYFQRREKCFLGEKLETLIRS